MLYSENIAVGLQLRNRSIEYKAKVLGVLIFVDPKNTSRQCPNPECQYIDKRNRRKTRDLFQCLQCGFTAMADYVGAIINIRLKAKLMAELSTSQ